VQVQYLQHMGSDRTVLNAARASYNKEAPENAPINDKDKSLLLFLARGFDAASWDFYRDVLIAAAKDDNREIISEVMWLLRTKPTHFVPFAHPQISFRITAPLALARQLWKAHIGVVGGDCGYAAWSEESFRYLDKHAEAYLPTEWRKRADNTKQGSSTEVVELMASDDLAVFRLREDSRIVYDMLVKDYEIAPEQARLTLLAGVETTWIWTGSLMFFARVCYQRLDNDAQTETRLLVKPIAAKLAELFPYSWEALTTGDIK